MVLRAVEKLMKETAMNGNIPGKFTSGFNRPNFSLVMLFKQVNVVCSQLLFHHMSIESVSICFFFQLFSIVENY